MMQKLLQSGLVLLMAWSLALLGFASAQADSQNGKDDTMQIRYISFGNGEKTMVVVPGLTIGFVTDNAAAIEDAFAAFTDAYTVYLFDIREDVPENYTIRQMGEDLAQKIRELGLKQIYLYGCSMGGMQSIYLAGRYPELVEKVAVAASACQANASSNAVVERWIQLAQEGDYREMTADMGQRIYSRAVYQANEGAFAAMADGLTQKEIQRFIRTAETIPNMDITEEAAAITCPVLVLGSAGDRVLTVQASEQIAEITGGTLYLYGEEYPHAVYDEAPDLRERVKAFFDCKEEN